MNINEAYPSDYLKASDLKGQKIKAVVDRVEMSEFNDGSRKPTLYFKGKDKGMVLNKTNAMILGSVFSPETDGWAGKEVALYSKKVSFNGQMVDSLAVEPYQPVTEFKDDEIGF